MGVAMHAKSDSETSIDASSPPRSPRRTLYYVQSPSHSHQDAEKMSYASSPFASPPHPHYHCSPIHHSRESSTSRFSAAALKLNHPAAWKRLQQLRHHDGGEEDGEEEDDDDELGPGRGSAMRFYVVCFVLSFVVLFTVFSLILWAASAPYQPKIFVQVSFWKKTLMIFLLYSRFSCVRVNSETRSCVNASLWCEKLFIFYC